MDDITEISAEAIDRYFNILSKTGYKKDSEVFKLIAVLFIEEIFIGSLGEYVTEEDLAYIDRLLYNLYGTSCLLALPTKLTNDTIDHKFIIQDIYRESEDSVFRNDGNKYIRTKA